MGGGFFSSGTGSPNPSLKKENESSKLGSSAETMGKLEGTTSSVRENPEPSFKKGKGSSFQSSVKKKWYKGY